MTKAELRGLHGDKLAGVTQDPAFLAMLDCAREDMPGAKLLTEPTALVKHAGFVEGWMDALKFLKTIAKIEPKPEIVPRTSLYPDPGKHNENS